MNASFIASAQALAERRHDELRAVMVVVRWAGAEA